MTLIDHNSPTPESFFITFLTHSIVRNENSKIYYFLRTQYKAQFFFTNFDNKYEYSLNFYVGPSHTGENPSLNQIGHVSRIYLTTMHVNSISNKKIQKNPENPENIESG